MDTQEPDRPFDRSDEYASMLERGLRLSGENRDFFMRGRVRDLRAQLPSSPARILDFGCGVGDTAAHLAEQFPGAEVVGVDTSTNAIEHAARVHAGPRVRFELVHALEPDASFDLCYTNGVFHHIAPALRASALRMIHDALAPGGRLALMENNPWNPGTRLVMARIPFDRDAVPLSPPQTRRLLADAGFARIDRPRFLFWFPRFLSPLRVFEPRLVRVPLGAQYYFLATKA